MIVVRDVFQLRFGTAREAAALWNEGLEFLRRSPQVREPRLLTDLTGPYYTLVLESSFDSLGAYETTMRESLDDKWRAWYSKFTPLVVSGHREIFNVVGATAPSLGTAADRAAAKATS